MQCLNPISIVNPSKYFSLDYADRFVLSVRCGKCANCQKTLSTEWYFRTYYEFTECVKNGGYVLFDCLTYRDEDLPKISRYFDSPIPADLDYPCFSYSDVRLFLVRLRRELGKHYDIKDNLRYFYCTEYGTSHSATHRPHVHILFFILPGAGLDNYTLSRYISRYWSYGRSDGIPYKSRVYVDRNTIKDNGISALNVSQYVAKYVNKSSYFTRIINNRVNQLLSWFYQGSRMTAVTESAVSEVFDDDYYKWLQSDDAVSIRATLLRNMGQFHRQSLHFGLSAIQGFDVEKLMKENVLVIPDAKNLYRKIALPTYYKRKLFYHQVEIDGRKYWQPTELGKLYKQLRDNEQFNTLAHHFAEVNHQFGEVIPDVFLLADYVLHQRGRLKGSILKDSDLLERLVSDNVIYSYSTRADKRQFRMKFITDSYHGIVDNYLDNFVDGVPLQQFISDYVVFDVEFERQLNKIDELLASTNESVQDAADLRQELENVYKALCGPA